MIHNRKVCKNEVKNTCHRAPAGVSVPRPFWTHCLHTQKGWGWGWICPVSVPSVGRMGPAVTRINIYLLQGAGEGGARRLRGGGSVNESKPGGSLVRSLSTHRGAGREGRMRAGGIKRWSALRSPRMRRGCWSRNTVRLWPSEAPLLAHTLIKSHAPLRCGRGRPLPGVLRAGGAATVTTPGRSPASGAPCRARAPRL